MPDESNDVVFTNTKMNTLILKKTITDKVSADTAFSFEITLKDKDGNPLTATYGDVSVQAGKATVSLKGGESCRLTDLPDGTVYTIEETNASAYSTTIQITGYDGTVDEANKTASGTVYGGTTVNYTNDKTVIVPTGIRLDILPYAVVIALAACLITLMAVRRRKHTKLS
jgi:hypothetical protein